MMAEVFPGKSRLTLVLALGFMAPLLHAQWTAASVTGRYGFHALGWSVPSTGVPTPFAFSGYWEFDGIGNFTAQDTLVQFTSITPNRMYGGTYQVNPDGTGTFTITLPGAAPFTSSFTIVKGGTEVEVIHQRAGIVVTFSLVKQ
jgi:hypothetical protein